MYSVSTEYKEQIKQPLRNPSRVKVLLDMESDEAKNDSILSASTEHAISNISVLNNDYFINDRIGTFEANRFVLDGESSLALYNDPAIYQGYLSNVTANVARNFTTPPTINIAFGTKKYELDGISFIFDSFMYSYPNVMNITAYDGASVVLNVDVVPDNYEWTYDSPIPLCSSIVVTASNMDVPAQKFRIEKIIFGIVKEFDSTVITDCNWKRDVDLVDSKLPVFDFDFTFLDINKEFNPDDDSSLYKYLSDKQRVRFYYGYDVGDINTVMTVFNNDTDNSAGLGIGTDLEYVETSLGKDISIVPTYARYVRLYSNGSYANAYNHYVEVEVYSNETGSTNLASGKVISSSCAFTVPSRITDDILGTESTSNPNTGLQWIQIDLGDFYNINDIKVWHYYTDGRKYKDVIVQLSNNSDFLSDTTYITEWMKGSEYFTTGDISVDSQSSISTVTIKSSSRLAFLTQEYTDGKYLNNPWSLHALLSLVIEFIGINSLYTDYSYILGDYDALSIQTTSPLPNIPINQLLQLIANAGMCVLDVDRDGKIIISPRKLESEDFSLTFSDMMKPPLITKYPQLQGVDSAINIISKESTETTIIDESISVTTPTIFEYRYDGFTDVNVSDVGLTITNEEIYDTLYRATINGTGTLTIKGKKLITVERAYSYEYQSNGERCPIKNELVSTESHADLFTKWIADYASCSNQYEIEDRGFPEIDITDNIVFDTLLTKNLYGTIFYNEISYNGALKGKTKILMAKGLFTTVINTSGTFNCGQSFILPIGYNK